LTRSAARFVEVELSGVDLHRDGRAVLAGVSWRIRAGERWVVTGANGAGKTQLLKLVAGDVWPDPDRGTRRYRRGGRWQAQPYLLKDEIAYVGPERQDRYERHGWNFTALEVVGTGLTRSDIPQGPLRPAQARAARALLTRLRVGRLGSRRFLSLSMGERRLVLLARALASRPGLLLLDELLAGLDAVNRARAISWLESTRRGALPWVLSTHRDDEVPRSATHRLRLEAGRVLEAGPIARAPRPAGQRVAAARLARTRALPRLGSAPVLVALERASVYLDYRAVLREVDLELRAGECWVVHGANGSGKSTLLRAVYGDHPAALGGRIMRRGLGPGVPLGEFRRWCAIVAPHLQSDYPREAPLLEVVVSGLRSSIGLDAPPTARERARARSALGQFGLAEREDAPLGTLSYGQARRAMFARAWAARPRLLLLDEPFAGVDPVTRETLRRWVGTLPGKGIAVLMSSHHPDEWPDALTGAVHLRRGRAALRLATTPPVRR
jgi:molybdate transport system ATP-binding protein